VIDSFLCSQTYTTQKANKADKNKIAFQKKKKKSFPELILELSAQTRRRRRRRRSMSEGEARAEDFVTYSIAFFFFHWRTEKPKFVSEVILDGFNRQK
jgi:hypothetical protein